MREQNVEFGVVLVKDCVVTNHSEADKLIVAWMAELGRPVVLLGERQRRTYGRRDLAEWVASIDTRRLPWRRMTVAA
ncbi:hypothetical protein [Bradyrhizobium elkanii]|uniref:hypothetical protein n=1 Tax=Bradyrhizobium elkanii TaxID=29448 RepID=UPI003D25E800